MGSMASCGELEAAESCGGEREMSTGWSCFLENKPNSIVGIVGAVKGEKEIS
jgi:hypothetical protein